MCRVIAATGRAIALLPLFATGLRRNFLYGFPPLRGAMLAGTTWSDCHRNIRATGVYSRVTNQQKSCRCGVKEMLCGFLLSAVVATSLLTVFTGIAQTGLETLTISFTGSDFSNSAPVDPVTGMATITLDPTVDETNQTAGIELDSLNIPLDSAIAYNFTASDSAIVIGGMEYGVNTLALGRQRGAKR